MSVHSLQELDRKFIMAMGAFQRRGYQFDSEHALRSGTQYEGFGGFLEGLKGGQRHGYFEIPTGVGKTALFISLIENYVAATRKIEDAPRVLVVVPKQNLLGQTALSFAKFMPDIAPLMEAQDDEGKRIDWGSSEIGLQFSRQKDAARKPKILLTTYASLIRDTENRTYPPNEYGFIIYDEGHALTAPKFGEAVHKFTDSIQLAVTATPDYSEVKALSGTLPHCYYRLPLKTAIERGDLCQVRPVLLKTGHTLNTREIERIIEEQSGRRLTSAQMEKLLNRETRNLAGIKTYLLGEDPDTGERYFGQTGLVFAGGRKHCDDFCRQMENVVSKPKYREFREWMKENGTALIAPVHGAVPKQGVPLAIGGGPKRLYTKENILELHDEGKILLLTSDQELKEGSNFEHDSFVMELMDRISVVDAKQRFGRGFRLDDDNPEKFCTAINLVDENTYETYRARPQMLPIYAAEILEGAEFRTRQKRPHLLKTPPKAEALEYELITDIDLVRATSERYMKRKEEAQEERPEHMLPLDDFIVEAGTGRGRAKGKEIQALFDDCEAQYNTTLGAEPIFHKNQNIDCRRYKGNIFAINRQHIAGLGFAAEKTDGKKPKDMLGFSEFLSEVQAGKNTRDPKYQRVQSIFAECEKQFKSPDADSVRIGDLEINCGFYKNGPRTVFCIDKKHAKELGFVRLEQKPAGMLSFKEFCTEAKIGQRHSLRPKVQEIYTQGETEYKATGKASFGKIKDLNCGVFKYGTQTVFCIDDGHFNTLLEHIKEEKAPTPLKATRDKASKSLKR